MHVRYCTQSCWTCREKEKSFARQYNVMQTSLHGGFNGKPSSPLSRLWSRGRYMFWGGFRRSWPLLFTPKVFALTWHDDVGHIMHMLPCSAYFRHHICHLLSLDMFYNAICLVSTRNMPRFVRSWTDADPRVWARCKRPHVWALTFP